MTNFALISKNLINSTSMNFKRLLIILLVLVLAFAVATVLYMFKGEQSNNVEVTYNTTEAIAEPESGGVRSMLPTDFVDAELVDYEIIGKWYVIKDDGYVIARKDGRLWSAYYDKAEKSVGVLIPMDERVEDGDTIIYCEESPGNEYMIIRDEGLCIYGDNGLDPIVWPREY